MTVVSAAAATAHDDALDLLSGMAVALGHDVDLDFLLAELATGVRRTLDAERVSVLLLDDDGRLTPAVAVARQHNDDLWQRFRRMPPIALDALPGARAALGQGKVIVIDDAADSPLVPSAWQRTFALGSLAIAPLLVDEAPAGLVAVEYGEIAAHVTPTQLALLEGMAALAGIALRAGRQRRQVQRLDALTAAVAAMGEMRTPRAVAEHALSAALESSAVGTGLFGLLSPAGVEVVAVRGPHLPEPGRYELAALPNELVTECRLMWTADPRAVVAGDLDGHRVAVVPVGVPTAAVLVLPFVASLLAADVVAELQLLAAATGIQLHAVRVSRERDWHRRALSLLADAPARLVDSDAVAAWVEHACALLSDAGLESPRLVVERSVARTTGLAPARADVARLLGRWRRAGGPCAPAQVGRQVAVPVYAGDRVLGALLAGSPLPGPVPERHRQVIALLGDLLGRAVDRDHASELELRVADAAAHTAVATRAYREAGQLLALLSNSLHAGAGDSPRTAGAEQLVGQVRRLLRDATEVLAPATARQADLRLALTSLAKQIGAHGGPETVVRQIGRAPALDAAVQVAVLRAVQRALALLRELRAVAATVVVDTAQGDLVVAIRADELLAAAADGPGLLAALRDARAWLSPVGGSLEISQDDPEHGFVLRAPTGSRQPAHPTAVPGESTTAPS